MDDDLELYCTGPVDAAILNEHYRKVETMEELFSSFGPWLTSLRSAFYSSYAQMHPWRSLCDTPERSNSWTIARRPRFHAAQLLATLVDAGWHNAVSVPADIDKQGLQGRGLCISDPAYLGRGFSCLISVEEQEPEWSLVGGKLSKHIEADQRWLESADNLVGRL